MTAHVAWTEAQLALFERRGPKGRRPARAKPKPALEVRTHIALADLLHVAVQPGWWWSHIGHGGKRNAATGALLKRMGLRPGIPDFLFISPGGKHHWLELKRGKVALGEAQFGFADMCGERWIPYAVARSFGEAEAQLKQWGVLR